MTAPTLPLRFLGAPGSPYTRKMRALLRYRQLPYRMILNDSRESKDLPAPRVRLLPTFILPGAGGEDEAVVDSTPLIRRFEADFEGRSVIPRDPALAFVDALLEDYGDEWLTKAMFHYRWYYRPDTNKSAAVLPRHRALTAPRALVDAASKQFAERQIGRLYVVGSNDTTASVIEDSYRRFLRLFDTHMDHHPFLFGERPASSDFACYGQLTQLALFDPTPAAVTLDESPRVVAWVEVMEDLSGLEPTDEDWITREAFPQTLRALLGEVGRVYAPFLLANASALERGAEQVETTIDGRPWVQQPFPYQGKCLKALRQAYGELKPDDRTAVDGLLAGSGCETLFA